MSEQARLLRDIMLENSGTIVAKRGDVGDIFSYTVGAGDPGPVPSSDRQIKYLCSFGIAQPNVSLGTGDDHTVTFSGVLPNLNVKVGTVVVSAITPEGDPTGKDSTATPGVISGDGITGTVDYTTTGAISVTFTVPPPAGVPVTASYEKELLLYLLNPEDFNFVNGPTGQMNVLFAGATLENTSMTFPSTIRPEDAQQSFPALFPVAIRQEYDNGLNVTMIDNRVSGCIQLYLDAD